MKSVDNKMEICRDEVVECSINNSRKRKIYSNDTELDLRDPFVLASLEPPVNR